MTAVAAPRTNRRSARPVQLAVLIALAALALIPFASYPQSVGVDWLWYRNGIDRLVAGQPIYDPAWLLGPFNYVAPANYFQFNQAPWLLPIVGPFTLLPEPVATYAWLAFMDAALLLALALVLPRWPPLLAVVLLAPPVLMSLVWGNVEALVAVGVAFWIVGRRRDSTGLETAGIVLASIKVVPAIPLLLLAIRSRRWKAAAASIAIAGGVSVVVSLMGGQNILEQFIRITANIEPVVDRLNISPAAWLGASSTAYLAVRVLAVLAMVLIFVRVRSELAALATLELACCFLATNLYVDWLVTPGIALLAWAPVRRLVRDRSLRAAPDHAQETL